MKILIVGAGFSGAVVARELAESGHQIMVVDRRNHIGGNCHTERDASTGVMVHRYGPHIFHTSREDVWNYVNRFGTFRPFINRVKSSTERGVFSLPINLHTINQFFGKNFSPDEARAFVATLGDSSITEPKTFEDQALKMLGKDLYETFFLGYTIKQWGVHPRELPASILKRLPVRFNYDDCYYDSRWQAIPEEGYTEVVRRILDHPGIEVRLGVSYFPAMSEGYGHTVYTGPIDAYFGYAEGRLGYRTVYWDRRDGAGDMQGNAVINYPDQSVPFTRVHEHKHFTPWETHEKSMLFTEFSKETHENDEPYYPKRLSADMEILAKYQDKVSNLKNITFLGRLATYRYMDMHHIIGEALNALPVLLEKIKTAS